jgi:MFS family permease
LESKLGNFTFQNLSDTINVLLQYDLVCDNSILLSIAQSCGWVGMLAALLVGGPLSDNFGRRIFWYFGCVLVVVGTWIMVFPKVFVVFIVCRIFIGIGAGTYPLISLGNGDIAKIFYQFLNLPGSPLLGSEEPR